MRLRRSRGFTLVELLVVISIIALLLAVLLPVLSGSRGRARNTVDLSNQRQMALAMLMYAGDYDDFFPPGDTITQSASLVWFPDRVWDLLIRQYDVPEFAFGCNSLETIRERWPRIGLYQRASRTLNGEPYTVMGWNYFGNRIDAWRYDPPGFSGGGRVYVHPRLASAANPMPTSRTLLTCAIYNAMTPAQPWESVAPHSPFNNCEYWEAGDSRPWRDPQGIHVAATDGSAEWVPFSRMKPLGGTDYYYFRPD